MDVALDDGRLPDPQVPDDQDFEEELPLHGSAAPKRQVL